MDTKMKTCLLIRCFWFYFLLACLIQDGRECYQLKECVGCCPKMFMRTGAPKFLSISANTLRQNVTDEVSFHKYVTTFVPFRFHGGEIECFEYPSSPNLAGLPKLLTNFLFSNFKEENVQQLKNMKITNIASTKSTLFCKNTKDDITIVYLGTTNERYFMAQKATLEHLSLVLIVSKERSHIFANGIFTLCEGGKKDITPRVLNTEFDFNAEAYIDHQGTTKLRTFADLPSPFFIDWFFLYRDSVESPVSLNNPWFFNKHINLKSDQYLMLNPTFHFQNDQTATDNPTLWMNFITSYRLRPTTIYNMKSELLSCCGDFTAFSLRFDYTEDFVKATLKDFQWEQEWIIYRMFGLIDNNPKMTIIDMRGTYNKNLDLGRYSFLQSTVKSLKEHNKDLSLYIKVEGKIKGSSGNAPTLPESEIIIVIENFEKLYITMPRSSTVCREMTGVGWEAWKAFNTKNQQGSHGQTLNTGFDNSFCASKANKFAPISLTANIAREGPTSVLTLKDVKILSYEHDQLVHRSLASISFQQFYKNLDGHFDQ